MIHLLWASLLIPIAIHLVHRRKAKRVMFSTLRFLRMVDQRVARRQKLRELLLLGARLLLLAAVVAALYRPMVRSATFQGGGVPTAAALVLDNTCSMRAAGGGVLRFDRARTAALRVLDGLRTGDAVSVVLVDEPPGADADPSTGLTQLRDELGALECGYGAGGLAGALDRAMRALESSTNPRKEIYVLTDFQRGAWSEQVESIGRTIPERVPVFLVDVGGPTGENLALTSAEFGLNVQVAGAASEMYCTVRNTGLRSVSRKASIMLEGEKVAGQDVTVASGGELTAAFAHTYSRTGDFWGEVRLDADELDGDNARFFAARVHEKLPVLIVDGDPSDVPYRSETFYLELALRAPAVGGKTVSPVETKVIGPDALLEQRLSDYAAVLMANVPRLDELRAERLRDYVSGGGGLVVFLGDRVDAASYNTTLAAGDELLLPGTIGSVRTTTETDGAFRIRGVDEQHPIFRSVLPAGGLAAVRVERQMQVEPAEGEGVGVSVETEAGPLLLERHSGAGTVLLCATSADLDWCNLPARPFFLPVLHQLVYYVGRPAAAHQSLTVGQPCVLDLPAGTEQQQVTFEGPLGSEDETEPVTVAAQPGRTGGRRVVFSGTQQPGVYRASYSADGSRTEALFAVNVDPGESSSERLEPEEAARLLGAPEVRVVHDPDEIGAIAGRERSGLPLWDYLFLSALILAVVESYLGNVLLRH